MNGSTGFIGTHLRKRLEGEGYEVFALVRTPENVRSPRDLFCEPTNEEQLKALFQKLRPTFVLSLAGRCAPGRNLNNFNVHYEDNVLPALGLARTVPPSVQLALFFGSCEEYGNGLTPFREEQAPIAFSPYGWAKISAHYATLLTCRERAVRYCWLRPFLTFGPGQETEALIPSVIKACLGNKKLPLTAGEQTRDFIYVNDLVEMICLILRNPEGATNQTLNLGSGVPRSIREVASKISEQIGRGTLEFGRLPYRSFEAMSFYSSMEKFHHLYGKFRYTNFDEALRTTITWSEFTSERLADHQVPL